MENHYASSVSTPERLPVKASMEVDHRPCSGSSAAAAEQHEWSLHSNATPSQCQLCALHLCQLYTLQSVAHMTVQSHTYDMEGRLVVAVRCARCMGTSLREADAMLRDDAVLCLPCGSIPPSLSTGPMRSAHSTNSSSSRSSGISSSGGSIPSFGSSTSLRGSRQRSTDSIDVVMVSSGDESSVDEDVSIISMLHSQVVSDANQLRRRISADDQQMEGRSKHTPIVLDSVSSSSSGHSSPSASIPSPPRSTLPTSGPSKRVLPNLSAAAASAAARRKRSSGEAAPRDSVGDGEVSPSVAKKVRIDPAPCAPSTNSAPPSSSSSATPPQPTFAPSKPLRSRVPFNLKAASGNSFAPLDRSDIFSSFVRVDPSDAARKQQALFEKSRARLQMRRQMNVEPPVGAQTERLPFQTPAPGGASQARREHAPPPSAREVPPLVKHVLPPFFRSEHTAPYTQEERAQACEMILSASGAQAPPCKVLCLPNMQPSSWSSLLPGDPHSSSSGVVSTPAGTLSHHYRRLAKLVHPDKCAAPTAESAFKILHQAYTQLLDVV